MMDPKVETARELLLKLAKRLPTDFAPYSDRDRDGDWGPDCSCGCRHFLPLNGVERAWAYPTRFHKVSDELRRVNLHRFPYHFLLRVKTDIVRVLSRTAHVPNWKQPTFRVDGTDPSMDCPGIVALL